MASPQPVTRNRIRSLRCGGEQTQLLPHLPRPFVALGLGKCIQAALNIHVFASSFAAETVIVLRHIYKGMIACKRYLVWSRLIGGPGVFMVVQGNDTAESPSVSPKVAHHHRPDIKAKLRR